jgi:hypothetical protein
MITKARMPPAPIEASNEFAKYGSNRPANAGSATIPTAILVAVIAGLWKAFEKAGQPGWAAIIPIYNVYIMIKISGNDWWWLILFFIPFINLLAAIKIGLDVAKGFGQGLGFGLGLVFLGFIFWPLLGFGDYQYQGAPA